ncbi:MAG: Ppx/GppA family phosphatase [Alphaproteobacteria bacterium]|nr:Ppx/GppA family phosphatase [Alphaproteobacteria bacterium]
MLARAPSGAITACMFESPISIPDHVLPHGRIAIVDIGSNSIRLVVYDQQKRSPVSIYNEKVMCGLGRGLANSGKLHPAGVVEAKAALARFLAMGRNMDIQSLYVMATAAVRDASDGGEFVRYLEREHTIKIDVISGEREARLGAYGVCSSMHKPSGLIGDLGGGSMELVEVHDGAIGGHTSLPLGSLRMFDETKGDRDKIRKLIDKRFGEVAWLEDKTVPTFYAIGGSFRALAKMYMTAEKYPLHILHEFTVEAKPFLAFVREIATFSNEKLEKYPGSAAKRVPQLPGAALLLEKIMTTTKCGKVTFSASGIREGYLYEMLPDKWRSEDGLISSCSEFSSRGGRTIAYSGDLYIWMAPLMKDEDDMSARLRLAFCLLSEIALHIHPEYRAEWAFERVLFSALTCFSHRERVKLALAMYHRYQYKSSGNRPELKLISESDKRWAKLVGTAANLAYHLSGSIAGNLHHASLDADASPLSITLSANMKDLMGDAVLRRLNGLEEAYRQYLKK